MCAGARRLDRGVEREEVRLVGDLRDHRDEAMDLRRRRVEGDDLRRGALYARLDVAQHANGALHFQPLLDRRALDLAREIIHLARSIANAVR